MRGERELVPPKPKKKKKRMEWSKLLTLLVILFGFLVSWRCLDLMEMCIAYGYTASAGWLTAGVGTGQAVIAAGISGYLSLCKSDHKEGGITHDAARANGYVEQGGSIDSPEI